MLSQCLFQLFPLPLRFDIQAGDLLTIASRPFILGSIDDNIRSTVSIEFVVGAQSYLHLQFNVEGLIKEFGHGWGCLRIRITETHGVSCRSENS